MKAINGKVVETEITFTDQEASALLGLIDIATKAGGLQVATNAVVLAQKIDKAFKASEKQDATVEETPKE